MRKMLRKIPEGDWLCEECQLKEDIDSRKVDRPEKPAGAVKESELKENANVKVDRSEKASGIAKGHKIKEHAEVKNEIGPEAVYKTSKESKVKVDIENNKRVEKLETVSWTPKPTCLKESTPSFANASSLKLFPGIDIKAVDPSMRRVPRGLTSPRTSAKRLGESQEVSLLNGKRPSEICDEYIEMGSPRKKPTMLRENSFKNVDMGKSKVASTFPSNREQSVSFLGSPRSQSMLGSHLSKVQAQPQPSHGKS